MRITTIQTSLFWEDIDANLKHLSSLLEKVSPNTTDLIVLPEMFSTGFTMNVNDINETFDGEAVNWLKKTAKTKNSFVTGSLVIKEYNDYYNRLFWVNKKGEYLTYDKHHLFTMAKEQKYFKAGKKKLITSISDTNFNPIICYDLRFPDWCRNQYLEKKDTYLFDAMVVVANWPAARIDAWDILLKARAIENQCFVIGVNRIGEDGNGIPFCGGTSIYDAKGKTLYKAKENQEEVKTTFLNLKDLESFRKKFPVLKDA